MVLGKATRSKNRIITIVMILFSNYVHSQNDKHNMEDYSNYMVLVNKIDSLRKKDDIKSKIVLKQKITQLKTTYSKTDTTQYRKKLDRLFTSGEDNLNLNKLDSSKINFITYLDVLKNNYLLNDRKREANINLSRVYSNMGIKDSAIFFLKQSMLYNYDGINEILDLCNIDPESNRKDIFYELLNSSNLNYIRLNKKDSLLEYKILSRYIYFNDQFARVYSKSFNYNLIHKTDSLNQLKIQLLLNDPDINLIKYDMWVGNALNIVFLHSAAGNFDFFENNFHKYVQLYNNNFKIFTNIAYVFDFYLYYKYQKRYFTSDLKPDKENKLILFPKLNELELEQVLKQCKISNLVY